jgi:hypothetical protein
MPWTSEFVLFSCFDVAGSDDTFRKKIKQFPTVFRSWHSVSLVFASQLVFKYLIGAA